MSKASGIKPEYAVGYGRPPTHSRFQPGQSGNPAGRRKGHPSAGEVIMKEAARLVKVKQGDNVETITKHEAIIRRLLQSAMEGDIPAARLVLMAISQNAPTADGGAVEDETGSVSVMAMPDEDTLRRMLARFEHLNTANAGK